MVHLFWVVPTDLKLISHEAVFKSSLTTMHLPNCLAVDSVGRPLLDSSNHESHAVDANSRACPRSHPYRIPRIIFNDRLIDLCLNDVRNSVDVAHPDCGPEPRR
jgi:hypothetical protein